MQIRLLVDTDEYKAGQILGVKDETGEDLIRSGRATAQLAPDKPAGVPATTAPGALAAVRQRDARTPFAPATPHTEANQIRQQDVSHTAAPSAPSIHAPDVSPVHPAPAPHQPAGAPIIHEPPKH